MSALPFERPILDGCYCDGRCSHLPHHTYPPPRVIPPVRCMGTVPTFSRWRGTYAACLPFTTTLPPSNIAFPRGIWAVVTRLPCQAFSLNDRSYAFCGSYVTCVIKHIHSYVTLWRRPPVHDSHVLLFCLLVPRLSSADIPAPTYERQLPVIPVDSSFSVLFALNVTPTFNQRFWIILWISFAPTTTHLAFIHNTNCETQNAHTYHDTRFCNLQADGR